MKQAPFQAGQPSLTPEFVRQALGSAPGSDRPAQDPSPFTGVTTDSRKAAPGCLFVALPGEKFDGHDFIAQALKAGARGVLCRTDYAGDTGSAALFRVADPVAGFRQLAAAWRRQFRIPVICVAGSHGKTTTKEILASMLGGRYARILKTQASQNGFLGIPMTLLELRPEHEAAVVEVGIDEIGAMQSHLEVVEPTLAVLTAIGPEHLERLRDVPTVAREEGLALTRTAKAGGFVAIALDDPWIAPHFEALPATANKLGYSLLPGPSGPRLLRGEIGALLDTLTVQGGGFTKPEIFTLPLPGAHNAMNLLSAIALARAMDLSGEQIRRGIARFEGAEGRSQVREIAPKTPVLCDYYNANPASTRAALELLSQLASRRSMTGRRWACLADMLELGPEEQSYHRGLAEPIRSLGIEQVLLFGPRMRALREELDASPGTVLHFTTREELARYLVSGVRPGDAILIKGSRGMRMEEVWKTLEARFLAARS